MCAGPEGASDASLAIPDYALALAGGGQAELDSVTFDSDISGAFGSYGAVAPRQGLAGMLYFELVYVWARQGPTTCQTVARL